MAGADLAMRRAEMVMEGWPAAVIARGAVADRQCSQASMDLLLEAGLIQPAGQKEAAGRPTLWTVTPVFLAHFGLRSIRDLPGGAELTLDPSRMASGTRSPAGEGERADAAPPG
jgi:segregation and condensation protein B